MGKKFEIITYRRKPPKYREEALKLAAQYVKRGMDRSRALKLAYKKVKERYHRKRK